MSLPFNLQPAPAVQSRYIQVDLAPYAPEHAGWVVVFDADAPVSNNENAFNIADARLSGQQRVQAMYDWITGACVAWNFTQTTDDGQGNVVTELMPQPRDGGAQLLPQSLLRPITEAFSEAVSPTKN
jgi:hypothetical protein